MKCCYLEKPIFKDVVIIGNGPSGICLSLMLDGWTPFLTGAQHPDEFLAARLGAAMGANEADRGDLPLVNADLLELAQGLDGRTTNPVSLLYDALMRPCADMGMQLAPLLQWRRTGHQFAKYGHDCEVDSNLTKLKIYQPETSEITRCMFNLRCVNEVYWEGNQFLKSQWNTEIEHFKHAKFIYLIHPFSKIRKWWEMFMALIFLLQFITIPLEMASVQGYGTNKPHHQLFFQAGRFILDCSCLVDICMTCCTGYCDYNKREVIMHPLGIIRHYVQKFLFVDIVSSIPESLISYLLTSHEARARYKSTSDPKNINVIRVIITHISMIKVLRMVTFMHYCRHYLDLGRRSRKGAVFLRLLLVFVVCLLLVHLMICAAISVAHYYEPETIIKDDGVIKFSEVRDYVFVPKHGDDTQLHGSDSFTFTEFYIRYFYETIIMLSRTGTGFRRVRSLFVNVYVSIIWFSSLIVYFIIIAYIMGVVTTHNASKHKYIEMVQQLREYMRYKQLPEHIQRRLIRNYEFRFQKTYFRENVILATISGHLRQIDHLVLGKGPPGGSWHSMDPHILTLSLASWMALPGLPFHDDNTVTGATLRASALQVATYYERYVREMHLDGYFSNNVIVTQIRPVEEKCPIMASLPFRSHCEYKWVQKIKSDWSKRESICTRPEHCSKPLTTICNNNNNNDRKKCITGYLRTWMPRRCSAKPRAECLRGRVSESVSVQDLIHEMFDPELDMMDEEDTCVDCVKERANGDGKQGLIDTFDRCRCNRENNYRCLKKRRDEREGGNHRRSDGGYNNTTTYTNNSFDPNFKNNNNNNNNNNITKPHPKWLIDTYNKQTRTTTTYICNTLVLANGAHDLPNKLSLHRNQDGGTQQQQQQAPTEPSWLLHDVRRLEIELDLCAAEMGGHGRIADCIENGDSSGGSAVDPVLVVGAGLSAADAILATRKRGIAVLHVFRNNSSDLIKKLPENMYPEYHKIHQMMLSTTSPTPHLNYTPFPAHTISAICAETNTVTIADHLGNQSTHRVSFAAVLIGSRPDLAFLPPGLRLGVRKASPVDSKANTVRIDRLTHAVSGLKDLYALGPLAGDNFVRFLPGGCVATMADLYRRRGVTVID